MNYIQLESTLEENVLQKQHEKNQFDFFTNASIHLQMENMLKYINDPAYNNHENS